MNERPRYYADVESCVEEKLSRVGRRIALGTPLGLGKANHIVNEFFRRAREDPGIDLHIFTALSLARPTWKNDLERRFLEPLVERLFGGYPELAYVAPCISELGSTDVIDLLKFLITQLEKCVEKSTCSTREGTY